MLRRPPDALFVPAHTLPLVLPRRSVTTLHDVAFMVRKEAYTFAERLYHRFAARFAVRRAAALLTVSEFSKSEIVRFFGARPESIAVTPLGYDLKNCLMAESEPRSRQRSRATGSSGRIFSSSAGSKRRRIWPVCFRLFRRSLRTNPGPLINWSWSAKGEWVMTPPRSSTPG